MEISELLRGYILEVFDVYFVLFNLGFIGIDSLYALDCLFFFSLCFVLMCGLRKYLYNYLF